MKKTYVLDTNVLLTDPSAIFSFEEHDIVLPFTVLEELDKFKTRQDELGINARNVNRQLSHLMKFSSTNLKDGIKLPSGGFIKAISTSTFNTNLPPELNSDKNDNVILSVCADIKDSILVTNDLILRIIADGCGISAEEYKKLSVADSGSSLYHGVKTIDLSDELIAKLWSKINSKDSLTKLVTEIIPDILPNQFIQFTNANHEKPFIIKKSENYIKYIPENYDTSSLKPKNIEQMLALDLLFDTKINLVTVVGLAGSGKTLMALSAGLDQVLNKRKYKSLIVLRPVQPLGKEIGYLPGDLMEKMEPWIAPIKDNLRFLINHNNENDENTNRKRKKVDDNTLNYYFDRGIIEVEAMTYIRGRSIADAYMIIDEAQNLSAHELKTIITRVGSGTKIVLTGDIQQIDNIYVDSVSNGLAVAVEKFKKYPIAGHVTLFKGERSELANLAAEIL